VFEIEAGPYKANNRITGRIIGNSADISFTMMGTPERDKKFRMIGNVNRELPAGKYVLEYTHEISGKSEVVYDTLFVYEVGIMDEKRTTTRIASRANYGSKFAIDMVPASQNDISASQFKTYISFDGGSKKAVAGYKIIRDNDVEFMANYNKVNVELVWIQPYTDKEFTLYSTEAALRLDEPAVLALDLAPKYTASGNKIKLEISGVTVLAPSTGLADKNVKCSLSEPTLKDAAADINGYSVTRQPEIVGGDAENVYVIEMEITKNSGANVKSAEGRVTIPISVTAKHPTNGKTAKTDNELSFTVDYTPSSGIKAPPGGGGSKTPPKPNAPAPKPKK
jgi:hypothetical protein